MLISVSILWSDINKELSLILLTKFNKEELVIDNTPLPYYYGFFQLKLLCIFFGYRKIFPNDTFAIAAVIVNWSYSKSDS